MNLLWRFLWVIFFSKFSSPTGLLAASRTQFRVLPTDVDVLLHMNNGRYFSLMDLARFNFIIRNKIFIHFKKHKIYAVAASEMIRFKKSLQLFQRFEIVTYLLGWDQKFFYFAHYFVSNNETYALSIVKGCFMRKAEGSLSPHKVLALFGYHENSPPIPEWVNNWQQADHAFYKDNLNKHS